MTDRLDAAEVDRIGRRVVLAAGRHWTHCDRLTVTGAGARLDLDYRGNRYTVAVDQAGEVTGLPVDMPLFRRVAIETHLRGLVGA